MDLSGKRYTQYHIAASKLNCTKFKVIFGKNLILCAWSIKTTIHDKICIIKSLFISIKFT